MHAAILAVLLLVSFSEAQTATQRDLFIDILQDESGAPYQNLDSLRFGVKLNGKPVTVASVARVRIRPKVAIVVDTSGSMAVPPLWKPAFTLAANFVRQLSSETELSLVLFGNKLIRVIPAKSGRDAMLKELEDGFAKKDKRIGFGKTELRDAMIAAIHQGHFSYGDSIIVITDGGDNASSTSENELHKQLASTGTRVFSVLLLNGPPKTLEESTGPPDFLEMASSSGAVAPISNKLTDAFLSSALSTVCHLVVEPITLKLNLPNEAAGKLKIEVREDTGQKLRNVHLIAPRHLAALHPATDVNISNPDISP